MILPWNRPNTAAVTIIGIHFPCVWFQIELKNTPRNTASSQIAGAIPTTIIAIRTSLGSNDPTKIIFPVWFSTICAGIVGIVSTKLIIRITEKGCE